MVDVSVESPASELAMIERELEAHSPELGRKPRLVILTKADILPDEERATAPGRVGLPQALLVSAHSGHGIDTMLQRLWEMVEAAAPVDDADGEPGTGTQLEGRP